MARPVRGRDEPPAQAEWGRLRAALARRGLTPGQVDAAAGNAPAGRTRRQIAAAILAWLKSRPKGV